jgi:hypothetical protein
MANASNGFSGAQELTWLPESVGNTSSKMFEQLIFGLSEAVVPMAPFIVQDHIALMGESMDTFPNHRLKELFERICQEIVNDDLRIRFQKSMSHMAV